MRKRNSDYRDGSDTLYAVVVEADDARWQYIVRADNSVDAVGAFKRLYGQLRKPKGAAMVKSVARLFREPAEEEWT